MTIIANWSHINTLNASNGYYRERWTIYASGRYWVVYIYDGSTYVISSTDGINWGSPVLITANSVDDVAFRGAYIGYIRHPDLQNYTWRIGGLNSGGTITWQANEQTYSGINWLSSSLCAFDDSYNLQILYGDKIGTWTDGEYRSTKGFYAIVGNAPSWFTHTSASNLSDYLELIIPLATGENYYTYHQANVLWGRLGSTEDSIESDNTSNYSAISDLNSNIYLAYSRTSGNNFYIRDYATGVWTSSLIPGTSSTDYIKLTFNETDNTLWALRYSGGVLYYATYDIATATWGSWTEVSGYLGNLCCLMQNERLIMTYADSNGVYALTMTSASITTLPATAIKFTQATLNGELTGESGEVYFEWGLTNSYGNTTGSMTISPGLFVSTNTGLTRNTLYHFRAVAVVNGTTLYGSDLTFSTCDVIVEMAFGYPVFSDPEASPSIWTDVSSELMGLDTDRGRMHELDRIEAGTAVIKMNNESGNWWRNNTAGAYYGTSGNVKPLTLTRVKAAYNGTTYPLFYGYIEKTPPSWLLDGGYVPVVEIQLVDFFKSFARYSFTITSARTAELSGLRFSWILDQLAIKAGLANWPANLKDITAGTGIVEVAELAAGTYNVLEQLQLTAEAEGGLVMIAPDGKVTFQDQTARYTVTEFKSVQSTFSDDGSDEPYILPKLSDDDSFIYNNAHIKGDAVDQSLASTAQETQGPRLWEKTDSLINNTDDAFDQCYVIVGRYSDSIFRCESLLIDPEADPVNLYPIIFGYDISYRINLELNSTRNPAMLDQDYHIEGIKLHWTMEEDWTCEWQLWDVNKYRILRIAHEGWVKNEGAAYNTVQAAATGVDSLNDNNIAAGQEYASGPLYTIWRGYGQWDASGVTGSPTVAEAWVAVHDDSALVVSRDFKIVIVPGGVSYPLDDDSYGDLGSQTTNLGELDILTTTPAGWHFIPLNATGIAYLNVGGTIELGFRTDKDIAASAPTGAEEMLVMQGSGLTEDSKARLILRFA